MFSDTAIHFLQSYEANIVQRWSELARQRLSPDLLSGSWFQDSALRRLYRQLIDAFVRRVYRDLNRTIETLSRSVETPSPLEIKLLLDGFASSAYEEFELREDSLRDAQQIRADLNAMGQTLKQVYSERLCPQLLTVFQHHRDDIRERWLRDLPTARISDHFSLLSEEDQETFVDHTLDTYEAIIRGREGALVPHPQEPQTACTRYEAWIYRQVDYFTPKGFALLALQKAVAHFGELVEPLLARAVGGDAWTYRVSTLLLGEAERMMVEGLSDAYMERFTKDVYGEVGIMLHRIKNKLTSVPSTMRTVLAVADEEYGAMFDPMVLTVEEAGTWSEYDQLASAAIEAENALLNGTSAGGAPEPEALEQLRQAHASLAEFTAVNGERLETIRNFKNNVASAEMLHEMLGIVYEGGLQTQQLTQELQLRMNEMYEREPPRLEALHISELVGDACHEAEVDARAKDITFTFHNRAEGVRIFGVRRDIGRPFVQVIDNAIKYTPQSGEVTVTLQPDGDDHVLFSCKDTGIGIPPGEEEQVCSLCERCSNAKEFASGTGTGLYYDRITVMEHNGEMWLESGGVGQGSTFFIRLPVHKDGSEAAAAGNGE
ncbi:MAG: hypothetical protein HYU66_19375 [Armatimonadetes bacterium]|nr:hypothetical protein [Armatimonadota bacterium]